MEAAEPSREGAEEGKSFDNAILCDSDGGEVNLLHNCLAFCFFSLSCVQNMSLIGYIL